MTNETNHALEQAKAQLESIVVFSNRMAEANKKGDSDSAASVQEEVQNDALEVQMRSDWHGCGKKGALVDYFILLCTGGPAVRIISTLGGCDSPDSARLEYQD